MGRMELVIFDMDGTIIRNMDSLSYLCRLHQVNEETLEEINRRERRGQITWIDADYERVKLIAGLELGKIETYFDAHLRLINGIRETIDALRSRGIVKLLATSGPKPVAELVARRYGFDDYFGSEYEIVNGRFTGRITLHMEDTGKANCLRNVCKSKRISLESCVAVGDNSSDIEVFRAVGRSIAINYSRSVVPFADYKIITNNLLDVLPVILGEDRPVP